MPPVTDIVHSIRLFSPSPPLRVGQVKLILRFNLATLAVRFELFEDFYRANEREIILCRIGSGFDLKVSAGVLPAIAKEEGHICKGEIEPG